LSFKLLLSLFKGYLPDGQQLGVKQDNEIKHRPGFDLTFSVPKSVSLLALLGEDQRIFKAVQNAVDIALEQIELGCAQARITQEGD
jgi:conjugative relaxase-like TrwC/TraI family protein